MCGVEEGMLGCQVFRVGCVAMLPLQLALVFSKSAPRTVIRSEALQDSNISSASVWTVFLLHRLDMASSPCSSPPKPDVGPPCDQTCCSRADDGWGEFSGRSIQGLGAGGMSQLAADLEPPVTAGGDADTAVLGTALEPVVNPPCSCSPCNVSLPPLGTQAADIAAVGKLALQLFSGRPCLGPQECASYWSSVADAAPAPARAFARLCLFNERGPGRGSSTCAGSSGGSSGGGGSSGPWRHPSVQELLLHPFFTPEVHAAYGLLRGVLSPEDSVGPDGPAGDDVSNQLSPGVSPLHHPNQQAESVKGSCTCQPPFCGSLCTATASHAVCQLAALASKARLGVFAQLCACGGTSGGDVARGVLLPLSYHLLDRALNHIGTTLLKQDRQQSAASGDTVAPQGAMLSPAMADACQHVAEVVHALSEACCLHGSLVADTVLPLARSLLLSCLQTSEDGAARTTAGSHAGEQQGEGSWEGRDPAVSGATVSGSAVSGSGQAGEPNAGAHRQFRALLAARLLSPDLQVCHLGPRLLLVCSLYALHGHAWGAVADGAIMWLHVVAGHATCAVCAVCGKNCLQQQHFMWVRHGTARPFSSLVVLVSDGCRRRCSVQAGCPRSQRPCCLL